MEMVNRMSIHESEQQKMMNWKEAASRPRSGKDYPRLEEEAEALGNQPLAIVLGKWKNGKRSPLG